MAELGYIHHSYGKLSATHRNSSSNTMTLPDNAELKARERRAWAAVADGWMRRDEVLAWGAAPVTARMLELAGISAGDRVLDIASGVGEPAISAARLAGATGRVVGIDLVEDMIVHAREKAAGAGVTNLEFHCMDGETLDFEAATFDAATCRWGLMFMPEPETCLRRVNHVMKEGARLVLACWAEPQKNPFVGLLLQTLGKYTVLPVPPPGAPGIFALADPDRLHQVIEAAGFRDIAIEALEINVVEVDDGQAYWDTMSDLAAPVMTLVEQLADTVRDAFIEDVITTADALRQDDTLRMPGTTWVASALK
ncbi:MAG: class I SAM-dependent methyltransferase [Gammaproteobacteria bacterium]|jgi:SAM-dependent methyltransferase